MKTTKLNPPRIFYVYGSTNVLNLACEVLWLQLVINNTVHYQSATEYTVYISSKFLWSKNFVILIILGLQKFYSQNILHKMHGL